MHTTPLFPQWIARGSCTTAITRRGQDPKTKQQPFPQCADTTVHGEGGKAVVPTEERQQRMLRTVRRGTPRL